MKIALDAMGGDFAPKEIIEGAILAAEGLDKTVKIVLIGHKDVIEKILAQKNATHLENLEIVHAETVIEMGEHPTKALSQKPNSSIAIGFELLKNKQVDAFCSAGNTGAMHVGAMFSVKTVEAIQRPALMSLVPKEKGGFGAILDVGANADCKPEVLHQFGIIGSVYCEHVLGISNPKVGLMNLGEEEQKGNLATQAAYQLLKNNAKINFIGNIEGRDIFNDKADVIVCDGYVGNVIIKMAESIYDMLKSRNLLDAYFEEFNYEKIGGSPILGINGNVIIGHGVSNAPTVKNMLLLAKKLVETNIYLKIKQALSE